METTALWWMRACWGVDAAAAAPPSLGGWVGCSWGGGNRWLAVGWVDRCFEHLLLLVFSRSRCPSLPSLRPCWPRSWKLSDGFFAPLRLSLPTFRSRPPAKFGENSIVGTKKCFCILLATAIWWQHDPRYPPSGSDQLAHDRGCTGACAPGSARAPQARLD